VADLKKVCRKHGCTINDLLLTVFTTQLQVYENKVKGTTKDTTTSLTGNDKTEEGVMMVVINLRDAPKTLKDLRRGGNQLHYEIIKFPLCEKFQSSLERIKSQLDDFKNSHRLYYLYTAQWLTGALLPAFVNHFLINGVMRKGTKISITNICGPEEPLEFGYGNKARSIMFANYYEEAFLQVTVFSYCGRLRLGINVGKMKIDSTSLMTLVDNRLHDMIKETHAK